MRPPTAPAPCITRLGEADFVHQAGDRLLAKADRGRQRRIDGILAARRANLAGVAREPIGEILPREA